MTPLSIVIVIAVVATIILWIAALVSISGAEADALTKGVWAIVILISPLIGAFAWFGIGRPATRNFPPAAR